MATGAEIAAFAGLTVVMLGSGVAVFLVRRLVHATLLLALVLLMVAFSFLLLGNDVLAAVQVLIYVGAVITLILFTIMFTYEEESAPDVAAWEAAGVEGAPSTRFGGLGRAGPEKPQGPPASKEKREGGSS